MADSFGISQLVEYLTRMGLKLAKVDQEQEIIELAFHGDHGQWRMIVGVQQGGDVKRVMLIAPHIGAVTAKKRLECLEALMAVNYRIAIGKFGLDLDDGEVRLEEAIPLANGYITYEQFQLAFSAIMQTVVMYHSLLPRIIYGNASVQEALSACEQEFFRDKEPDEPSETADELETDEQEAGLDDQPELNVDDVLAEVTRLFEKKKSE